VIGTGFWSNFSNPSELSIWNNHLAALATASGHSELIHAPLAPIGLSNGGQMSYGFNTLQPEKVIAFIANKGCCYNNRLPSEAALQTPGLLIAGELDTQVRRDSIRGLFDDNRPRGALWAWVEEENTGHARTDDEIVLPFMAEAIRLRYPSGSLPSATAGVSLLGLNEEDGWLADQSTWMSGLTQIAAYDDYVGDESTAGWLLNDSN
jgi:dienelactone hydrolase